MTAELQTDALLKRENRIADTGIRCFIGIFMNLPCINFSLNFADRFSKTPNGNSVISSYEHILDFVSNYQI